MKDYKLKFGSNEKKSVILMDTWLDAHPDIDELIDMESYGETDGRHADIEAYCEDNIIWVGEIKIDTDASTSFNSGHMYNNFAQLRDDYPTVPKYLIMVDSHTKTRKYIKNGHGKFYMVEAFSKDLIARCFTLAQMIGKAIPYYISQDYFGDRVWKLCKHPVKEVDCGIRYLERKEGSPFEQSLQAYDNMNAFNAAAVQSEYRNWRELIWAGTGWDRERHELIWLPNYIQLDQIFPPTGS